MNQFGKFGIAVLASVMTAFPAVALDQMTGGKFVQVSNIPLNDKTKEGLARFKKKAESFGAMYVKPNGRAHVWYSAMFSAEDADEVARTACNAMTGEKCILYARMDPRKEVKSPAVPAGDRDAYRRMVRGTESSYFAAMAVTKTGMWGTGFDAVTAKRAQELALESCEEAAAEERADDADDKNIQRAFDRKGFYKCRVIFTMQKG